MLVVFLSLVFVVSLSLSVSLARSHKNAPFVFVTLVSFMGVLGTFTFTFPFRGAVEWKAKRYFEDSVTRTRFETIVHEGVSYDFRDEKLTARAIDSFDEKTLYEDGKLSEVGEDVVVLEIYDVDGEWNPEFVTFRTKTTALVPFQTNGFVIVLTKK